MGKQNTNTNAMLDLDQEAAGQAKPDDAGAPDFEAALAQLEALVGQMERGDLPLEQSIKAYAKGVELVGICQKSLDAAEQRVQVLQDNLLRSLNEDTLDGED
ncbi:exodeoxyribonuclease VII small subunit [Paracandidimonas soli]|uniref:Exodeoxyribonuclease 7 small subunit n=1 Tax=Paracandidimonas soli TaxID=1917182 RepID=A0A4V2VS82_9BURK|nr:exodeoxyribonuclease VII small subunit [Paracandidimonas soli]